MILSEAQCSHRWAAVQIKLAHLSSSTWHLDEVTPSLLSDLSLTSWSHSGDGDTSHPRLNLNYILIDLFFLNMRPAPPPLCICISPVETAAMNIPRGLVSLLFSPLISKLCQRNCGKMSIKIFQMFSKHYQLVPPEKEKSISCHWKHLCHPENIQHWINDWTDEFFHLFPRQIISSALFQIDADERSRLRGHSHCGAVCTLLYHVSFCWVRLVNTRHCSLA